jgi:hypothetical protein
MNAKRPPDGRSPEELLAKNVYGVTAFVIVLASAVLGLTGFVLSTML